MSQYGEINLYGPNPNDKEPMKGFPQVGYLKNYIKSPNIEVGDYTYYDDPNGPENFESNVLYHFPFIGDKLKIGKFCAIAKDVKFIMNGANHSMSGFSTYPFFIFGNGWETSAPQLGELPYKGDTVIGNDVWLGYESTIMPGIKIGDGAIVASKSVVTQDVPPYSIVGGNPAKVLKHRFEPHVVDKLLAIAWWDWSAEKITKNLKAITHNELDLLLVESGS
ncbi:Vat family streptogramin A O-acetyltransferase [Vibrio cholerae]|uniref:Vat family streptogramin A O-acetyltransferase n=1 Tax=Vibrio cholerae TaxID=666 RepID=UPI00165D5AD2|nr:Vat family streptogramin A O-acetyltransferase [Vibrio cholerae]EGQ7970983.1 Vat family streptogramin A O-acetyltransferase [Vibrio cholerae]EGQ7971151.1 Vat family streptogramin A O-acetyltransferase [Vibrio cholerae]EJL6332769.1 Vat family streptogramin A O-acetyltransferase [Vibrio cholerae]EJL6332995.1 Vat family streptogramin A O-acetyltransferase [Vibrio cholerae]EJL6692154.1 Vat family streptogramin A O-acetyltransferase [Vibrio cholerae]